MSEFEEREPLISKIRGYIATKPVRRHFKRNADVYKGAGIATGTLAVLAVIVGWQNESIRQSVQQINLFSDVDNVQIAMLERRGHPGNVIRCNETGETFASQNRTAEACKVNAGKLSEHLNGKREHVNGMTFTKLAEAVA